MLTKKYVQTGGMLTDKGEIMLSAKNSGTSAFYFLRKIFLAVFVLCFFAAAVLADYKTTIQQANHYYGIGDYSQALELYREAYEEQPNPKLAYFIKKLEKLAD